MERDKELYPYWMYKTEEDDRVRDEHAALEGKIFRIGDPEGDDCFCPNGWNCRCHSEPVDDQYIREENKQVSKGSDYLNEKDPETGKPYINENFRFNPGKQGAYPNDSSYSEVFSSANKGNAQLFDLLSPKLPDLLLDLKQNVKSEFESFESEFKELKMSKEKYKKGTLEKTEYFEKLESKYYGTKKFIDRIEPLDGKNIDQNFEKIKKFTNFNGSQKELWGDGDILASSISETEGKLTSTVLTEDGYMQRTFEPKTKIVSMDEFFLNPLMQKGKGKGSMIFSNQVEQFKKLGYKKLVTEAGDAVGMNGYYTWARLGYEIKGKEEISIFKMRLKNSGEKDFKGITSLQQLMSSKKGIKWWKKNGMFFHGEFDLNRESVSMKALNKYLSAKK
jgi:hypothetical protein